MNTDNTDDYEAEWDDLDEKVILAQILTELQQIRLLLSGADTGARNDSGAPDTYECKYCEETVSEGKRERHAEGQHNAPPGVWEEMFEVVE